MKNKIKKIYGTIILIILALQLFGCSTVPTLPVDHKYNIPEASIMLSCGKFIIPEDSTGKELLSNISTNKKIYDKCNDLNESKKKYIETEFK